MLAGCDAATVFHTRGWARVLQQTYGHKAFYLTGSANGHFGRLLPIMEVSSPITGRRGISLPFTDICPVLAGSDAERAGLFEAAVKLGRERGWRSLEVRGDIRAWGNASPSVKFYTHAIELTAGPEALLKNCDPGVRRGIRKAEASGLVVEFRRDAEAVRTYFDLHCGTRRRHGVPPQPFRFFQKVGEYLLEAGNGFVALARQGEAPVAGAVYLKLGAQAIYKFGASDYRFQHLRPNNLVMWSAIRKLAAEGCSALHLGRTSLANEGLRRFKLAFGAREETTAYSRYDFRRNAFMETPDRAEGWANNLLRLLPGPLFRAVGRLLYPHLS